MALRVHAELDLEIDGQRARLTGSGALLRLELSQASILRKFLAVSLPKASVLGAAPVSVRELPALLAREGLTLEVADRGGLLLTLGAGAAGRSTPVPGLGRLECVALANPGAALRLLFNA